MDNFIFTKHTGSVKLRKFFLMLSNLGCLRSSGSGWKIQDYEKTVSSFIANVIFEICTYQLFFKAYMFNFREKILLYYFQPQECVHRWKKLFADLIANYANISLDFLFLLLYNSLILFSSNLLILCTLNFKIVTEQSLSISKIPSLFFMHYFLFPYLWIYLV